MGSPVLLQPTLSSTYPSPPWSCHEHWWAQDSITLRGAGLRMQPVNSPQVVIPRLALSKVEIYATGVNNLRSSTPRRPMRFASSFQFVSPSPLPRMNLNHHYPRSETARWVSRERGCQAALLPFESRTSCMQLQLPRFTGHTSLKPQSVEAFKQTLLYKELARGSKVVNPTDTSTTNTPQFTPQILTRANPWPVEV